MRVYIDCIGCEQRQLDTERVRMYLQANGFSVVREPAISDISILITCAVDERNKMASIKALHELVSSKRPDGRLIIGGCLPAISPESISGLNVSGTFTPQELERLDNMLGPNVNVRMSHISDPNKSVYDNNNIIRMNKSTVREEYDRAKRGFKIRINHGCLLSCSYCVIRNATGRLKSIPEARIIAALMDAAKRQEPTIMLMGGDTGAYGLDIGSSFAVLLGRLLAIEGNYLIFVHDFNINWFLRDMSEYMRTLMADSHRLRAICFPVQSGSDSILKRMRRPYKVRDVMHSLSWIKQHAPHIALGTHVIVGFPSEKESDFNQTIRLLCEIDFDFVTCFRYSEQSSAPSAKLNPKVPEEIKLSRLSRLHALLGERASIIV